MDNSKPILIVGLGNPGAEYAMTRHNAGFIALDTLAEPNAKWKSEHKSVTFRFTIHDSRLTILLAKPQTFMNLSGEAVRSLMSFYKIPLENLIVVHDDMDLKLGDIREKMGGGSAGHHGIESIDAAVGKDYRRLRIGVGHPRDAGSPTDSSDWVLGKLSADNIEKIAAGGADKLLQIVNYFPKFL
ncbi:peptidyl-tRNA hydrolase [Bacteroidia bacterium]|nr:peptidyl-tRNA hydrolase [Bacteroidia bacterium]